MSCAAERGDFPARTGRAADNNGESNSAVVRSEIADLYFWLGADAERFGFTPWQTSYLVGPRRMPQPGDLP